MRFDTVPVKNVARLVEAGQSLIQRAPGMPGMGLIHGHTGYGKTTATDWYRHKCQGIFVRAWATWTPAAMLDAILEGLHRPSRGSCAQRVKDVVEAISLSNQPLFVDEVDHIVASRRATEMLETLRDIHDMATVPVILVGEDGIDQKLAHRKRITGRIMQEVRFEALDDDDATLMAAKLCDVKIAPDLISLLNRQAGGSTRLIVVGLARAEAEAKCRGLAEINAATWGRRAFFTGDAPEGPTQGIRGGR